MSPLDFYFDFISPYSYLASTRVENLAAHHGRVLTWRPFRLSVTVLKVMGLKPLLDTPLKGEYVRRDVARLACLYGLPLVDDLTPFSSVPAQQLCHAVPAEDVSALAKALLCARWAQGRDISELDTLADVAASVGMERASVEQALQHPGTRKAVDHATRAAIDRGVFGSPTVAVADELFWGTDRLELLAHYLTNGEEYRPLSAAGDSLSPRHRIAN